MRLKSSVTQEFNVYTTIHNKHACENELKERLSEIVNKRRIESLTGLDTNFYFHVL